MAKKGLGKGLEALIDLENVQEIENETTNEIDINLIDINKNQPRKNFDKDKLEELARSIGEVGIIQPLVVIKKKNRYEIVAGERRYRAARLAGLKKVPVIVRELSKQEHLELSIIENIQREDLNPIEEAKAYDALMKNHSLKQEEIAQILGKSRSAVTNALRLLNLPDFIQVSIAEGSITAGHARALLSVEDPEIQKSIHEKIIKEELSVREAERICNNLKKKEDKVPKTKDEEITFAEQKFSDKINSKVSIKGNLDKGKLVIEYYSKEQLMEIFDMLK